jgi:hypothetical protein
VSMSRLIREGGAHMTAPWPDGPLVEPGPVWDESPAEAASADRRYWDDRIVDEPGFEMDGQQFAAGDRVCFPQAATRWNRRRVYEITETAADSIHVVADGCHYQLTRRTLAVLGIEHADEK